MSEIFPAIGEGGGKKGVPGTGIDDQFYGGSPVRPPLHPTLAVRRGRQVVEFADHDQCRNDEFLGGNAAKRIVGHGGLELSIPGDVKDFRLSDVAF